VLAYLSRYTHRVAISNRRLLAFNETGVTFRYKDYRRNGVDRQQVMTLSVDKFIRRFPGPSRDKSSASLDRVTSIIEYECPTTSKI
jgi:hypothetical protein